MPTSEPPFASAEARVLLTAGLVAWLLSALCALWEGLALQSPVSPLHVGVLAGPIGQLQRTSFSFGCAGLLLALAWKALFPVKTGRAVLALLVAGSTAQLAALAYAAALGLVAVQLNDPRADARVCLWVRAVGHALVSAGVVGVLVRALELGRREHP
jgi:hypothetical protein